VTKISNLIVLGVATQPNLKAFGGRKAKPNSHYNIFFTKKTLKTLSLSITIWFTVQILCIILA
jgi:hypothetical protein